MMYNHIANESIRTYRRLFKNIIRRHMGEGTAIPSLMQYDDVVLSDYIRAAVKYRMGLISTEEMDAQEDVLYDGLYVNPMTGIIDEFVETIRDRELPSNIKEGLIEGYRMYMPKSLLNDEAMQAFYDSMTAY